MHEEQTSASSNLTLATSYPTPDAVEMRAVDKSEFAGFAHVRSQNVREIALALALAQQKFRPAKLDSFNPFHNSRYASLSAIYEVIRDGLQEAELSILQFPQFDPDTATLSVETLLVHSSGQYFSTILTAKVTSSGDESPKAKNLSAIQKLGGAITYLRRYALAAILGLSAEEDTDGNNQHRADSKTGTLSAAEQRRLKALEDAKQRGNGAAQGQAGAEAGKSNAAHSDAKNGNAVEKAAPKHTCSAQLWDSFVELYRKAEEEKFEHEKYLAAFELNFGSRVVREFNDETMAKALVIISELLENHIDALNSQAAELDEATT